jgi:hypothetical protein
MWRLSNQREAFDAYDVNVHSDHVLISNFRFVAPKNQSNALKASSRIPRCDLYRLASFRSYHASCGALSVWTEGKRRIAQKGLKYSAYWFTVWELYKETCSPLASLLEYHQLRPTVHHSSFPHTDQISSQTNYPPWQLSERHSLHLHLHVLKSWRLLAAHLGSRPCGARIRMTSSNFLSTLSDRCCRSCPLWLSRRLRHPSSPLLACL